MKLDIETQTLLEICLLEYWNKKSSREEFMQVLKVNEKLTTNNSNIFYFDVEEKQIIKDAITFYYKSKYWLLSDHGKVVFLTLRDRFIE